MLAHPRATDDIKQWLADLLDAGRIVYVPEITDYEVRRELLRAGLIKSLRRLDRLKLTLKYLPITTEAMLQAAEFWADIRKQGKPTSGYHTLDADAILAGQAAVCSTRSVVIATTNPRHLARFVPAEKWEDIK
jgi:predicted nucleic acid-binding protein